MILTILLFLLLILASPLVIYLLVLRAAPKKSPKEELFALGAIICMSPILLDIALMGEKTPLQKTIAYLVFLTAIILFLLDFKKKWGVYKEAKLRGKHNEIPKE